MGGGSDSDSDNWGSDPDERVDAKDGVAGEQRISPAVRQAAQRSGKRSTLKRKHAKVKRSQSLPLLQKRAGRRKASPRRGHTPGGTKLPVINPYAIRQPIERKTRTEIAVAREDNGERPVGYLRPTTAFERMYGIERHEWGH